MVHLKFIAILKIELVVVFTIWGTHTPREAILSFIKINLKRNRLKRERMFFLESQIWWCHKFVEYFENVFITSNLRWIVEMLHSKRGE